MPRSISFSLSVAEANSVKLTSTQVVDVLAEAPVEEPADDGDCEQHHAQELEVVPSDCGAELVQVDESRGGVELSGCRVLHQPRVDLVGHDECQTDGGEQGKNAVSLHDFSLGVSRC